MKFYAIEVQSCRDKTKRAWYPFHYTSMIGPSEYALDDINYDCLERDIDRVNKVVEFHNKFKSKPKICEFELLRINDV